MPYFNYQNGHAGILDLDESILSSSYHAKSIKCYHRRSNISYPYHTTYLISKKSSLSHHHVINLIQSVVRTNLHSQILPSWSTIFFRTRPPLFEISLIPTSQDIRVTLNRSYCINKGIEDAGSTADFRMLCSTIVCLGLL